MGGERRPGLLRSARNDARHGGVHGVASTRGSAENGGRHDVSRSVQRTGLCGAAHRRGVAGLRARTSAVFQIGRASCRERVCPYVSISRVAVSIQKKNEKKKQG